MSEHKTSTTTFDKKAYWKEREAPSSMRRALRHDRTTAMRPANMDELDKDGNRKYAEKLGIGRAQRRHKTKNRQATKKGMTKVIKIDSNGQPVGRFVKAGGKTHRSAMRNSQQFRSGNRGA